MDRGSLQSYLRSDEAKITLAEQLYWMSDLIRFLGDCLFYFCSNFKTILNLNLVFTSNCRADSTEQLYC